MASCPTSSFNETRIPKGRITNTIRMNRMPRIVLLGPITAVIGFLTLTAIVAEKNRVKDNPYDLNHDGKVTLEDVSILSSHVER